MHQRGPSPCYCTQGASGWIRPVLPSHHFIPLLCKAWDAAEMVSPVPSQMTWLLFKMCCVDQGIRVDQARAAAWGLVLDEQLLGAPNGCTGGWSALCYSKCLQEGIPPS